MKSAVVVAIVLPFLLLGSGSACGSNRDVLPESKDVRGEVRPQELGTEGGYEHVTRRPLGTVALAEARGIPKELGRAATEKIADALQSCAADLLKQGRLVKGAARVIVRVSAEGNLGGMNVTIAPGAAVAANAILCFIAPIKALSLPPSERDAGDRALALEAAWEPP